MPEDPVTPRLVCRLEIDESGLIASVGDAVESLTLLGRWQAPVPMNFGTGAVPLQATHPVEQITGWLASILAPEIEASADATRALAFGQPLPVFIDVPEPLRSVPWELLLELKWAGTPQASPTFVRLAPRADVIRPPLRLPLTVLALDEETSVALGNFQSRHWMNEAVRLFAFRGSRGTIVDFAQNDLPAEIVLCPLQALETVFATIASRPALETPRLVVAVGESFEPGLFQAGPPAGVSLAVVAMSEGRGEILGNLLEEFAHNLPIHSALYFAFARRGRRPEMASWLATTPEGNEAFRLGHALDDFRHRVRQTRRPSVTRDPERLLTRLASSVGPEVGGKIREVFKISADWKGRVDPAHDVRLGFDHESEGVKVMAEMEVNLAHAAELHAKATDLVREILADPAHAEALEKSQERVVNIDLCKPAWGSFEKLGLNDALQRQGHYRLEVDIGRRRDDTLLRDPPPSFDCLLPVLSDDLPGWDLDVVVFPKSFTLLSRNLKKLRLPRVGGSGSVFFHLVAPAAGDGAELRTEIYFGNQLLQSFTLVANLNAPGIEVRCDFSQTAEFANLEQIPSRDLCLGLNDDEIAGTHRLSLKQDGRAGDIELDEKLLKDLTAKFRETLGAAVLQSDQSPWFPAHPPRPSGADERFDTVIRDLARLGSEIHTGLFNHFTQLGDLLREIATSEGRTLLIARKKINHAYPWAIVYDYERPAEVAGEPPPPVCRGVKADGQTRCDCQRETAAGICLNGFWGIRHQLEQLVGDANSFRNTVRELSREPNTPEVMLAVDEDDGDTIGLRAALQGRFGARFAEYGATDPLLPEVLWQEPGRPTILVCCGHLAKNTVDHEPLGARFRLPPGTRWFQPDQLSKKAFNLHEWKKPRTLVLLMTCAGAATEIDTLNDFALAFYRSGAAGLVGSEIVIFSGLASQTADVLTAQLAANAQMGPAFHDFVRNLARAGNPLGLGLTYIGSAELHLL